MDNYGSRAVRGQVASATRTPATRTRGDHAASPAHQQREHVPVAHLRRPRAGQRPVYSGTTAMAAAICSMDSRFILRGRRGAAQWQDRQLFCRSAGTQHRVRKGCAGPLYYIQDRGHCMPAGSHCMPAGSHSSRCKEEKKNRDDSYIPGSS